MSANTAEEAALDARIAQIHAHLATLIPDSKEYAAAADQLVKLQALKKEKYSWRPSPDTLVTAGAQLGAILAMIAYEQKHVITSKIVGFAQKMFR